MIRVALTARAADRPVELEDEDIVDRLLKKRPDKRYQSATQRSKPSGCSDAAPADVQSGRWSAASSDDRDAR